MASPPFRAFIRAFGGETQASPHARVLRTSFKQKLEDAFFTFAGSANMFAVSTGMLKSLTESETALDYLYTDKPSFGLLDFITLFIPAFLEVLTLYVWQLKNPLLKFGLGFILGLVGIPLTLIRVLTAALLAFNPLSFMVILAVHLVSEYLAGGAKYKENIDQSPIAFKNKEGTEPNEPINANDVVELIYTSKITYKDGSFDGLPAFVKEDGHVVGLKFKTTSDNNKERNFDISISSSQPNDWGRESIRSMLKLNFFRITEGMEGYISNKRNSEDETIKQNCADCREVLNLLTPR